MRIGHGYDAHRLTSGRELILGGIHIPHESGLLGHSDADVLTHAVMDALLGAAAMGDIGVYFPDTDAQYEGASSVELLTTVSVILRSGGYSVGNIDATIVAEKPKLSPYIDQMRRNLAAAIDIDPSLISIKATTTEGLGFTGECQGIEAHAVVLINN